MSLCAAKKAADHNRHVSKPGPVGPGADPAGAIEAASMSFRGSAPRRCEVGI